MRAPVHTLVFAVLLNGFALALPPTPGLGQEAGESLPRDLVLALLNQGSGENSLHVGSLPDGLAESLGIPPEWETLGGLVTRESGTVVVGGEGDVAGPRAYTEHLASLGWSRTPSMEDERRGFVTSGRGGDTGWCVGDRVVWPLGLHISGRAYLRIMYRSAAQTMCDEDARARRQGFADLRTTSPFPSLLPPDGVTAQGGGSGGGGGEWRSTAYLQGEMTPTEVLEHYSAQLQEAGWRPRASADAVGVAVRTFDFEDEDGEAWVAFLTALTVGEADRTRVGLDAELLDGRRFR